MKTILEDITPIYDEVLSRLKTGKKNAETKDKKDLFKRLIKLTKQYSQLSKQYCRYTLHQGDFEVLYKNGWIEKHLMALRTKYFKKFEEIADEFAELKADLEALLFF